MIGLGHLPEGLDDGGNSKTTSVRIHALFFVSLTVSVLIYLCPAVAHSERLGAEFGYTLGGTTGPFGTDLDL